VSGEPAVPLAATPADRRAAHAHVRATIEALLEGEDDCRSHEPPGDSQATGLTGHPPGGRPLGPQARLPASVATMRTQRDG
jgi:hypothetical protein